MALWILRAYQPRFSGGCYKEWPQGGSISSCQTLVTWATRALGQVQFLGCQLEWKHPRLVLLYFFPLSLHPPYTSQRLPHHSAEGAVLLKWATPRKEAGGGNLTSRRHLAQGTLQSSSRPETPPSSGGTRLGFAAGGSPWVWRVWPHAEGDRKSRSTEGGRGHIAWTPSAAPSAPPQSSLGTQACSGSRDVTPAQVPKAWGEERLQSFFVCLSVLNPSV